MNQILLLCQENYFYTFHKVLSLKELLIDKEISKSERIISAIESRNFAIYDFESIGDVESSITDSKYIEMVKEGIEHCKKGDVFQIVLSRKFMQKFKGEDFNVYRKLRRINPSPYLFYFDFGGIKIFGSSPETHCKIDNNIITIDPIAGTAFRTGDINEDKLRADALSKDPKENAEQVILVDLARNDLSRNAKNVKVDIYKELPIGRAHV